MTTSFKISIIALIFAGSFTACKTSENISSNNDPAKEDVVSEAPSSIENLAVEEPIANEIDSSERVFVASIERTPCYGNCPTYKMKIYSDGFVELEGIRGIDFTGNYTTNISQAQVNNFRIRANRTGFMDLEDRYDGMVTDLPSATTTIVLDGVKKSVYRRFDYPRSILQFEELFDALLKSQRWSKAAE